MTSDCHCIRNEASGYSSCLGISLQINVKIGVVVKCCLLHGLLYHVSHAEE